MNYYLVPGKKQNIQKSIVNNVNKKIKSYNTNEDIFAWGITENNKCKVYSQIIGKGDMFLIYYTNEQKNISYIGEVVKSIRNPELCKKIWGQDSKYIYVILIKNKFKVKISKKDIYKKFGYNRICGITKLSGERINIFKTIINDPDHLVNTVPEDNIQLELRDKFWGDMSYDAAIISDYKNSKLKKINMKKSSKGKWNTNSTKYPAKVVGLTGEKVVYDTLNRILKQNNNNIFTKLNINFKNGNKAHIEWFNEKVDIEDSNFEDRSIGKGYDIEFKVGKRLLKLEVKSSFNNINIINLTRNELIEMKKSKDDYYLVLVDNLKGKPRIKFVKNFSDIIKDEYIFMSLEHKLLIDKIDNKYFV